MRSGNTTNSTTINSNNTTKTAENITGMNNSLWLKLYVHHSDILKPVTVGLWAGMVLEETVAMFRSEKQKVFK